jgi:uncharacterized membrane protein YfcA
MNTIIEFFLIGLAAAAGGAVNALAGGGTLITFPVLIAFGIPPVSANVTNTVALCPGYFGATLAQWKEIKDQKRLLFLLVPISMIGGILGGILLLKIDEKVFQTLVPFLILLSSGLLAFKDQIRSWVEKFSKQKNNSKPSYKWIIFPIGAAAIYGGYFGAGLSVIVLAVLGLVLDDSLTRLNALKQVIALSVNITAAVYFLFSGQVLWVIALVMAIGSLAGGMLGGKLAGQIKPITLRRIVVSIGVIVAIVYWIK